MKRVLDKKQIIFSLVLLIIIANIIIISAAETAATSPAEIITSWWERVGGTLEFKFRSAQILFLILVTLIIFAISDFIPFFEQTGPWIRFWISLVMGILAVMFLAPAEIWTALMNFKAMGIALTTIIPLIVLAAMTVRWNSKYPQYSWVMQIMWVAFLVALWLKYADSLMAWWFGQPDPNGIGQFGVLFIAGTAIISIALMIFSGRLTIWLYKSKLKSITRAGSIKNKVQAVAEINRLERLMIDSPELAPELKAAIKGLKKIYSLP